MIIETPTLSEFETVKFYISKFDLDNRALEVHQFLIAKESGTLLGFLRMRTHSDCQELASLGVIENERGNGVSVPLVKSIIKLSHKPLYLVCIIPEFFEALGFTTVSIYPPAIEDKLKYCVSDLPVDENYVVMKYSPLQVLLPAKDN